VELVIRDCIRFTAFVNKEDAKLSEMIYKTACKYIEQQHNVTANVRLIDSDDMLRLEVTIEKAFHFNTLGEAVEQIAQFLDKKKIIEEDLSRVIVFYSEILREMEHGKDGTAIAE